ncbi:MAG: methionine synthase [Candidatus Tectomicrobia bacterium]|uniref:Methionine synthase n=1 Tax=Tectimicrobiota bacterium TaxID=2528274 RepID=A0A932CNQ9_UNCTE|nr:methionine synthase [Candidatus Tectomicrobia bacterium]
MNPREEQIEAIEAALTERILVLDGATGTAIQARHLEAQDFGGPQFEGCNEHLVITQPDLVLDLHRGYLEAGADIIETNTFGGTSLVLGEYGLQDRVHQINETAARLAREAAAAFSTPSKPRFVAGSMGPTTKAISVTGGVSFEELVRAFHDQAAGLVAGGVDLLLLETQQDTRNVKAGLIGIGQLFAALGRRIPVMVSGTLERAGTMLAGQSIEAFATSLMHADLLSIGLNCATGPEWMTDPLRSLAELAKTRVSCIPNAGLPDEEGRYLETPERFASTLERFVDQGWINLVGGCCGTTPAHIQALAEMVQGKRPRLVKPHHRTLFSGIDLVEAHDEHRPLIVGERTNEVGSRKFKRLISEERYEEASEIGRAQVKGGAQIIDVNLQNADRDEIYDTDRFYEQLLRKVRVPLMIDTTDPVALERALTYCQGKSIINSVNLEDGIEKFERVVPIARRYGAALIVGCIDEDPQQAQAITRERKLAIARRAVALLTGTYGIRPEDILIDPLVFPCATGDENYLGSAVETMEAVRLIKQEIPFVKTLLGISNVSFGLPEAGRDVLNSVFLYHCTRAGLDLAIVNPERLERYASIPAAERRLAEDLLWNRGADPVGAFVAHFRDQPGESGKDTPALSLDERLARCILEGTKEGLVEALEAKRKEAAPLEIINGPLMGGMAEVGRLFNRNELIIAEVLQSAEAMKAAVSHLEPFLEKNEARRRGRVLLATVKGDVHDIGKNLVEIVLSNNGYEVINLGIKVAPEVLIQAVREHRPDVIGLSGLLVKSAQQMVITARDLKDVGITIPLVVGGAALSDRFTRSKIAPAYGGTVVYARDAMNGLEILNRLMDSGTRESIEAGLSPSGWDETIPDPSPLLGGPQGRKGSVGDVSRPAWVTCARAVKPGKGSLDREIPPVPDLERHRIEIPDLDEVWRYLNPQRLYGRHLGFRGRFADRLAQGDRRARELAARIEAIQEECRRGAMRVAAIWQFFAVEPEGHRIHVFADPNASRPSATFEFPRPLTPDGTSLADLVRPPERNAEGSVLRRDHLALFVTTAGQGIRALAEEAKERGEYLRSHGLQALALETAEAAAEWLHAHLRTLWGLSDPPDLSRPALSPARDRSPRYSFGYAACPDLESQAILFRLLRPEEIGVTLTDGFMMDPEASVSAMVFHV